MMFTISIQELIRTKKNPLSTSSAGKFSSSLLLLPSLFCCCCWTCLLLSYNILIGHLCDVMLSVSRTGTLVAACLLLALGFMLLTWTSIQAGNKRAILLLACAITCGYIYQVNITIDTFEITCKQSLAWIAISSSMWVFEQAIFLAYRLMRSQRKLMIMRWQQTDYQSKRFIWVTFLNHFGQLWMYQNAFRVEIFLLCCHC